MTRKANLFTTAAALIAGTFALAACETPDPEKAMADRGLTPLTGAELMALVDGTTEYYQGTSRSGGAFEAATIYAADGTMRGKAWWSGGSDGSEGVWSVSEDGLHCKTWSNTDWNGGAETCITYYRDGDTINWYRRTGKGSAQNGVVQFVPGNPYAL